LLGEDWRHELWELWAISLSRILVISQWNDFSKYILLDINYKCKCSLANVDESSLTLANLAAE
jgi:hypothetical protein